MPKINNIAIVWESETGGGVNSYLRYLLQSKPFLEKKITIFTNAENKGAKFLISDLKEQKNIKFIFFPSLFVFDRKRSFFEKLIYYFLKPIAFVLAISRFKKILSGYSFEVLLCQCGNYGIFRSEQAAILAANKLKIPVKTVVIHHACIKPPLFMSIFFKVIDYFLSKSLTSLITVSKATKETVIRNASLLNKGRLQSYIIHNGVPKNNFIKKNYLNLKLENTNYATLKIGMVSRLSPDKGHEDLIKAFSILSSEYKKRMDVYFVGEDERGHKSKLKILIKNLKLDNKINFLDYVDLDSKKIILSLDLFISSTKKFEGFGLSIAEAMSVGVPVLATDVGAVNEFFNNDCGRLIKPGKIEDIKNSLIDFCDNKKIWDRKAEIAKHKIEKDFNMEVMGNKYMNHFISKIEKYNE